TPFPNPGPSPGPTPFPALVDVSPWADKLGLDKWDTPWSEEANTHDSLHLSLKVARKQFSPSDVVITVTATEDCKLQIYEVYVNGGNPKIFFGKDDSRDPDSDDAEPTDLKKGKPLAVPVRPEAGKVWFIAVACRKDVYGNSTLDLVPMLKNQAQ